MKLGISTYALAWSIGVPGYEAPQNPVNTIDLIEIAHKLNISLLQIADNIPLHIMSDEELEKIRNIAVKAGVELELGTRGTEPDHLLKYLHVASIFESKFLRTIIINPDMEVVTSELHTILPEFEACGVTIGVENHGLHTTRQLAGLFNSIKSPYLGCCLDTVNSFEIMEGTEQVVNNLLPYTVNLHIKDFDVQRVKHKMGFEILGKPAGEGRLGIPNLMGLLKEQGKDINLVIELWPPFTNNVEETINLENDWLKRSINNLKAMGLK
ncbi:MAG TPA: TIM barrel protein [Clostridia bacterium]|nr:TIM barrel protein [Clostridia bacterium]